VAIRTLADPSRLAARHAHVGADDAHVTLKIPQGAHRIREAGKPQPGDDRRRLYSRCNRGKRMCAEVFQEHRRRLAQSTEPWTWLEGTGAGPDLGLCLVVPAELLRFGPAVHWLALANERSGWSRANDHVPSRNPNEVVAKGRQVQA